MSTTEQLFNVTTPSGGKLVGVSKSNAIVMSLLEESGDKEFKLNVENKVPVKFPDHSDTYHLTRVQ